VIKRRKKSKEEIAQNKANIEAQNEFFLRIWKKRKHYSEVSGAFLGHTPLSIFFHHLLPKSKYPDLRFEEENIILLTGDEHTSVEMNMYKYEEINKRREKLLEKYG
jgi:hypothetical protein